MGKLKLLLRSLAVIMTCLLLQQPVFAQTDSRHAAIEKYLDSQTLGVGWVNISNVEVDKLADFVDRLASSTRPPAIKPAAEVQIEQRAKLKATQQALQQNKVTNIYSIVEFSALAEERKLVLIPTSQPAPVIELLKSFAGGDADTLRFLSDGDVVICGNQTQIDAILKKEGEATSGLTTALANNEGPHGLVALTPVPMTGALLSSPAIKSFTGDDLRLTTALGESLLSLKSISLQSDLPPAHARLQVETQSAEAAKKAADLANLLLKARIPEAADSLSFSAAGTSVTLNSESLDRSVAILQALQKMFGRPMVAVHMNNMKQIALALHNYMDAHGSMPPQALTDKNGKRLLSWRVLILPYLEQSALYNQFHLDEPWDSEHNLKLAESIPDVYNDVSVHLTPPRTRIVAPLTADSPFGKPGKPIYFTDVRDGTSNTIWLVQADPSQAVVWTKPEDVTIDSENPTSAILDAERPSDHIIVGMMDGSVQAMPVEFLKEWLVRLLSIDGGEVIRFEDGK